MRKYAVLALIVALDAAAAKAAADPAGHPRTALRIHGGSDLEPIELVRNTALYGYAQAVAHLEGADGTSLCTATRVGKDLFLTNFHCTQFQPCRTVQFHLGFEHDLPPERQRLFACREIVATSMEHDYAVYRVDPKSTDLAGTLALEADEFPVATLSTTAPALDQTLMAAGHPDGRPKEISRGAKCRLITTLPELIDHRQTLRHLCDTEGGSSGTPLMDQATGRVVALHWGGRQLFNMAIPMASIVESLRQTLPAAVFAQLRLAP